MFQLSIGEQKQGLCQSLCGGNVTHPTPLTADKRIVGDNLVAHYARDRAMSHQPLNAFS